MLTKLALLGSFASLYLFVSHSKANAYPRVEMQACLNNALTAVAQKSISATYKQLQQYCDCSLRKIIDESRDINASLSYCNKKYIY